VISEIRQRTRGERVQFLIEATGSGSVFDYMPAIIRAQGTVLLYGSGHAGREIGCLTPLKIMEVTLVTCAGASGGFDADGTPTTYRRSMEYIRDGKIDPEALVSHRYTELSELQGAFTTDFQREDFIKGVLVFN
jgi:L-iditol 2-dehydrogenase